MTTYTLINTDQLASAGGTFGTPKMRGTDAARANTRFVFARRSSA
jgi:hypothetical protein